MINGHTDNPLPENFNEAYHVARRKFKATFPEIAGGEDVVAAELMLKMYWAGYCHGASKSVDIMAASAGPKHVAALKTYADLCAQHGSDIAKQIMTDRGIIR